MPCRDYTQDDMDNKRDEYRDELADLLCKACTMIDDIEYHSEKGFNWPNDLHKWWQQHKKQDKENQQREKDLKEFERLKKKLRK